jgi:sulfite exporter TauE/SafE/plastocyanin domain-containing protein
MKAAIEKAGYTVGKSNNASTAIAVGIGIILAALYMIASAAGLFNAIPTINASLGYGMLFIVGLLTSVHCVAMCGGISLAQSVGTGITGAGGNFKKLLPGLLYNGGRVVSYTIVGGIVGTLGAAFSFSPVLKGVIAAAAGLFMILLGLKMLGVLSGLPRISRLLPARIRNIGGRFSSALGKRGPFAVGILNGLMPCGPLQTMQLYALGTGSMFAGALSMFIFSVGTVPLMLVFSLAATFIPKKLIPIMVRASAVLVMFLGLITFSRAASLAGIALPEIPVFRAGLTQLSAGGSGIQGADQPGNRTAGGIARATMEGGVQSVITDFGSSGYYMPFVVQVGIPVKWTIKVTADGLNGCNNPITIPSYEIRKTLVPGDNLIEFTPKKEGVIAYTCWMGMISSRITVVKNLADGKALSSAGGSTPSDLLAQGLGQAGGQGTAGCCSGTTNPAFAGGKVPTDKIGIPVIKDGIQEITIAVDSQGYSPAAIVLQKGMKAVIKFKVDELTSCNNPVSFPEYNGSLDLTRGQTETPPIQITQDFTFQCWMRMIHGYVKTVDDLTKFDMQKVKQEIGAYRATSSGCGSAAPAISNG